MLAEVGGKFQSVIVLIKGLVREPFMPVQRLGTGREPSSPVNPLAKAALSSGPPTPGCR